MSKINIDKLVIDNDSSIKIEDSDGHELDISSTGSIEITSADLLNAIDPMLQGVEYDAGTVTRPNDVTEIYEFRQGGASGTIVATITLTYLTKKKRDLVSWETVII
jgi:hypothetical protein